MAHSREVRLPYLSHELVEFIFSLPSTFKIHDGWSKYILRKSMENILPDEIVWRKDKKGFGPPEATWLKNDKMAGLIQESQNTLKSEGIIDKPNSNKSWQYIMAHFLIKSDLS